VNSCPPESALDAELLSSQGSLALPQNIREAGT